MSGGSKRLASLDGLRGVAALVVVVFHLVVSTPRAGAVWALQNTTPVSTTEFVLHYTPLRLLWAGSESVVVFYVLSGFVLTLPFVKGRGVPWRLFYPRRLVRLYLPAIASLVFAWGTARLVHRSLITSGSPWLNDHASRPTGLTQVLFGSSLMAGWGSLNTSLWSLRWEVAFSMLLPAFLFLAARPPWPALAVRSALPALAARSALPALAKAAAVVTACFLIPFCGFFYPDVVYIAVFPLGVLMATHADRLQRIGERLRPVAWWLLLTVAVLLLVNSWLVAGIDPQSRLRWAWISIASVGAALLVFAAAYWPAARAVLGSRPVRWLGGISFSLYLVQEPIVVGLAFATRGQLPLWLMLISGVPLSVLAGWVFHLMVERPSHRLARRIGASGGGDAAPAPQKATTVARAS